MRRLTLAFAASALMLAAFEASAQAARSVAAPAYVAAAVADPGRPAEDTARDANRHPAELAVFAGVKPGDTVLDVLPGGGYFTRIFAKIVGPTGRVVAVVPSEIAGKYDSEKNARAAAAAYPNVMVAVEPLLQAHPEHANAVDVIWTSQNYHDFHTPLLGSPDVAELNRQVFQVLKPGGVYIVVDHVAQAGSGARDADTLHRIDPALVRKEVEAAGFVFDGESNLLRNPADDHTKLVFDPSIRGKTDQFVYRFRKPARPG
ncbi:MAG TPA: methyltransferase domain-containing protein [Caulobacteraceae bacterium]|jgi:predicted methyltransferase